MAKTVNQAIALVRGVDSQYGFSESFLVKKTILDYFFRSESLLDSDGKVIMLSYFLVKNIAKETQTSGYLVLKLCSLFSKTFRFIFIYNSYFPLKSRELRIAPLRSTLQKAFKDCFQFMKAHHDMYLLRIQLDEQYFIQNYSTSIF